MIFDLEINHEEENNIATPCHHFRVDGVIQYLTPAANMPSSMEEDAIGKGDLSSLHSTPLERVNGAERSDSEYTDSEREGSDGEAPKEEDIVYEDVPLEPLAHPFAKSALEDENTELWLVRMPRHAALRKGVEGSEIQLADAVEEQSSATRDRFAGTCKGYYVYRDHGVADEEMRATFVTRDKSGKAKLQVGALKQCSVLCSKSLSVTAVGLILFVTILRSRCSAKPFARSISVTFEVPLKSLSSTGPPPRSYPKAPRGQKLRYFPIGSSRGM